MTKFKLIILFLSFSLVFSCTKENETVVETETEILPPTIEDLVDQVVSDSAKMVVSDLQSFTMPPEVEGCACYFSKNKEEFDTGKYIYVDDYGNTAYIKLNGKVTKIPMEEGDFDPSDFSKTISTEEFTLTIKGRKLKELDETMKFQGELSLKKKDGTKSVTHIYGECGC